MANLKQCLLSIQDFKAYTSHYIMGENGEVKNGRRNKHDVNWNQFGLSANTEDTSSIINRSSNGSAFSDTKEHVKELFEHEQEVSYKTR